MVLALLFIVVGCESSDSGEYISEIKNVTEAMEVKMEEQIDHVEQYDLPDPILTSSALLISLEMGEVKDKLKTSPTKRYKELHEDFLYYIESTANSCMKLSQEPSEEFRKSCLVNYKLVLDQRDMILTLYEKE